MGAAARVRAFALLAAALLVCGGAREGAAASPAAAPSTAAPNSVTGAPSAPVTLLVAGDRAQPVFDNAIAAFREKLVAAGDPPERIHLMTADPSREGEEASLFALLHRIETLAPRPGQGCLVFLTSHGRHKEGLFLAPRREFLAPEQLDSALAAGCGDAPTVVIVSGCYSGSFAAPPMTRPNRIVLTAARADRPSFGCAADRTYTFFDECLLGAMDGRSTWRRIFNRTRDCVDDLERQQKEQPSEPRAFFGPRVDGLLASWQR